MNLLALASLSASLPTSFMTSRNHLENKLHALESWFRFVSRGLQPKAKGQQLWGCECLGNQESSHTGSEAAQRRSGQSEEPWPVRGQPSCSPRAVHSIRSGCGLHGHHGERGHGCECSRAYLRAPDRTHTPSLLQKFPQTTVPLQAPERTLAEKPQDTQLVLSHSAPVACGKTPDMHLSNSVSFSGP